MIRTVWTLLLAGTTALILGGALSASATAAEFHTEVAHTKTTSSATSSQVLVTPAATITCGGYAPEGTSEVATTMELTLSFGPFSLCKAVSTFGSSTVELKNSGCYWKLTTATEPVHILCSAGSQIQFAYPGCTITIFPQTAGSVSYTNAGSGKTRDLDIAFQLSELKGSAIGLFCSAAGEFSKATFTGGVTSKASNTAGEQVGLWYE
jgi:hypothetical protein